VDVRRGEGRRDRDLPALRRTDPPETAADTGAVNHAIIRLEGPPIDPPAWKAFCETHRIEPLHRPGKREILYAGGPQGVQVDLTADSLVMQTLWGGPNTDTLCKLAAAAWITFGGSMWADEKLRAKLCQAHT
jgi:hypothetical protein